MISFKQFVYICVALSLGRIAYSNEVIHLIAPANKASDEKMKVLEKELRNQYAAFSTGKGPRPNLNAYRLRMNEINSQRRMQINQSVSQHFTKKAHEHNARIAQLQKANPNTKNTRTTASQATPPSGKLPPKGPTLDGSKLKKEFQFGAPKKIDD